VEAGSIRPGRVALGPRALPDQPPCAQETLVGLRLANSNPNPNPALSSRKPSSCCVLQLAWVVLRNRLINLIAIEFFGALSAPQL